MLQGLQDWREGRTTINSCLVVIAFGKFRAAGLVSGEPPFLEAELVLYDLLKKEGRNAYGRYNSLIRELVSFGRALARAQRGRRKNQALFIPPAILRTLCSILLIPAKHPAF